MKRFRLTVTAIALAAAAVLGLGTYYFAELYGSIKNDVEREVKAALADTDIDEMWNRALFLRAITRQPKRSVSGTLSTDDSRFVTSSTDNDGNVEEATMPVRHDISYSNQMTAEMSHQLHRQLDPHLPMDPPTTDSIMRRRLADRGIEPEIVGVELTDSLGNVLIPNPALPADRSGLDSFALTYNHETGLTYRVYITPLMNHILHEMAGVIGCAAALALLFIAGFWYLLHTVGRLRTLEEMKDEFVNNMTHELKTPIAIAYSANDALLHFDSANDPQKKEAYLRIALKQLTRLSELAENILAMSMERRHTMVLRPERIALRALAAELADYQRMRCEKPVSIRIEAPEEEVFVKADRTHLSNVVNNLIDNAIKYSGESVEILIRISGDELSVSDNGIGIPPRSLPLVFDRFYRVPQGNTQAVRGYGIGLYYVRSVLAKMGWSISATSRPGRGSTFTIKFQANETEDIAGRG